VTETWHVMKPLTWHDKMITCHDMIRRRAQARDSTSCCFRNTRSTACSSSKCCIHSPMPPLNVLG
jgi:hypothetical protein